MVRNLKTTVMLCLLLSVAASAKETTIRRRAERVRDNYLVMLRSDVADVPSAVARLTHAHGGSVRHVWPDGVKGFSVEMPWRAAEALLHDPDVEAVEELGTLQHAYYVQHMGPMRTAPTPNGGVNIYPEWWLDRLDQQSPYLSRYSGSYAYSHTGSGVRVYVVDNGIYWRHREFNKLELGGIPQTWQDSKVDPAESLRQLFASRGINFLRPENFGNCAAAAHGTSVASLINGWTHGVAKKATVVDVQAASQNCRTDFRIDDLITALKWIPTDPNKMSGQPAIVNISLALSQTSCTPYTMLNEVIEDLSQNHKLTFFVAAGNGNHNVECAEPANTPAAITLGAIDRGDLRWEQSNFGGGIEFWVPGVGIDAAGKTGLRSATDDCFGQLYPYNSGCLTGTSFAAPQAAGLGAIVMEQMRNGGCWFPTRNEIMNGCIVVVNPATGDYKEFKGIGDWATMTLWPIMTGPDGQPILQTYVPRVRP